MALIKPFERRNAHRYPVELALDLVLDNGSILPVTAINISEHGLQFGCDGWVANEIEPRGIHLHPLDHIPLKAVFSLHDGSKLYIRCRVVSARRLSQNHFLIGLEFVDFEGGGDDRLLAFLEKLPA